jgi:hypothetical protein
MIPQFFLGAYWPARKESIEQCAGRLRCFFDELVTCDPALANWFEKGRSRKQASERKAAVDNRDYLLELLDKGRHKRNMPGTTIEELGFHIALWNGARAGKEADLSITCGLYWLSPSPNASMWNCVTLNFPQDLGDLKRADHMARVIDVVARAWEPDWAGVMSKASMDARGFKAGEPFVDWMVYVSKSLRLNGMKIDAPASILPVDNLGLIVVTQCDAPDPTGPSDLQNVRRVEAALANPQL